MSDMIDKANADYDRWLEGEIARRQIAPTPTTECVDCGGEIGAKRKQALPHAIRCVGCQWQYERTFDDRGRR